jgi:hypothetical protein
MIQKWVFGKAAAQIFYLERATRGTRRGLKTINVLHRQTPSKINF